MKTAKLTIGNSISQSSPFSKDELNSIFSSENYLHTQVYNKSLILNDTDPDNQAIYAMWFIQIMDFLVNNKSESNKFDILEILWDSNLYKNIEIVNYRDVLKLLPENETTIDFYDNGNILGLVVWNWFYKLLIKT